MAHIRRGDMRHILMSEGGDPTTAQQRRLRDAGRPAGALKILPGALVVVGRTDEEAAAKHKLLDSLVHPDSSLPNLSIRLGVDASKFDLDAPLPDLPPSNQSQSGQASLIKLARAQNLTVRQLADIVGGYGGLKLVGTPQRIADTMQEWLETGASDGFNIMFPYLPGGLDDFVDRVVPELQRRGIFRTEYQGKTLRENLGLPRPENPFFANPALSPHGGARPGPPASSTA